MTKNILVYLFLFLFMKPAFSDIHRAYETFLSSKKSLRYYPKIVNELVEDKMFFASLPFLKEYMSSVKTISNKNLDFLIDKIGNHVGIRQFEVLPISILSRSSAPIIKYIMAKKYFRKGQYKKALFELNKSIPRAHPVKAYALLLEGSIFSISKKFDNAIYAYKECIEVSNKEISRSKNKNKIKQLEINRDYCIVGIARAQFHEKKYEKGVLSYLDLPKESYVWPEILFEEAWTSFYKKDYNRTLGKLVTYKAPVLNHMFNPEVDVLRALTFMELCLWADTKKSADDFYEMYQKEMGEIEHLLKNKGKDYKYFYLLSKSNREGKRRGNSLLHKYLNSIVKDGTFTEMYDSFTKGKTELNRITRMKGRGFAHILRENLKASLVLQRDLIGAYVRKSIRLYQSQLSKSFEHMSYIKLEILGRKKRNLYSDYRKEGRVRRNNKNLKKNSKQYFWSYIRKK